MSRKNITDEMVCHAYRRRQSLLAIGCNATHVYEALSEETGEPEKVCWRAMERAYERGLIDYGVSLRSGWLTDKGEALIGSQDGKE